MFHQIVISQLRGLLDFGFWILVDELCVFPIKTLQQNQQLVTFETSYGLYLCVTISSILIVHFQAYPG